MRSLISGLMITSDRDLISLGLTIGLSYDRVPLPPKFPPETALGQKYSRASRSKERNSRNPGWFNGRETLGTSVADR